MNIHLVRRWGQHKPGRTVEVGTTMGTWLVQHGIGAEVQAPAEEPATRKRPYRRSPAQKDTTTVSTGEGERRPGPRHSAPDTEAHDTQVQASEDNVKPRARRKNDDDNS